MVDTFFVFDSRQIWCVPADSNMCHSVLFGRVESFPIKGRISNGKCTMLIDPDMWHTQPIRYEQLLRKCKKKVAKQYDLVTYVVNGVVHAC